MRLTSIEKFAGKVRLTITMLKSSLKLYGSGRVAALHSFSNMFTLTLLMNLLVDGASRIGEFVPTTPEAVQKQAYLKRRHLEFWICNDESGDMIIFCTVLSKWLKNHTSNPDEYKQFVCKLLPPHMIMQDTCRLLIVLALHMGYFRDFESWDQLKSAEAGPHGSCIELKSSCLDRAVVTGNLKRNSPNANPRRSEQAPQVMNYSQLGRLIITTFSFIGYIMLIAIPTSTGARFAACCHCYWGERKYFPRYHLYQRYHRRLQLACCLVSNSECCSAGDVHHLHSSL